MEVELWMDDPTLSFTGVAIGHNVAATLFGGTMPLVATGLFYISNGLVQDEDGPFLQSLLPRLLPGFYISILGVISLYSSFAIRHPHDVRIAGPKLRAAVKVENKKFKAALKAKKKKRKEIKQQLSNSGKRR